MPAPVAPAPDEAQNRQLVQQMAMQGAAAARQAPQIGSAPEAMQTAMQRSAGINAPANFNATQTGTIQNPYTRADTQLAANNAGAGGVLGSISSSTRDYLQQAQGGVDLQREISRRAVQQIMQQHELETQQTQVQKLKTQADLAAAKAESDPNSIESQIRALTLKKQLSELQAGDKQTSPAAAKDISKKTNIPEPQIKQYESIPWYQDTAPTLFADAVKANVNAEQFAAGVNLAVQTAIDNGQVSPADGNNLASVIYQQYAPMLPGYTEPAPIQVPAPPRTGPGSGGTSPATTSTLPAAQQQALRLAAGAGQVLPTPATVSLTKTDIKAIQKAAKAPSKRK